MIIKNNQGTMDPADRKNFTSLLKFTINRDTDEATRDESIKRIKVISEKELRLIQARRIAQEKRTGRN